MSSMNVSLPEQMKDWVEARLHGGQYHNVSEYIRDLIRKDQAEEERLQAFRSAMAVGRESGIESRSFNQVIENAKTRAKSAK